MYLRNVRLLVLLKCLMSAIVNINQINARKKRMFLSLSVALVKFFFNRKQCKLKL